MSKLNNRKGFTLIELIVVITILAILAVIAVPRLTSFTSDAQKSTCLANQRTIETAYAIAVVKSSTSSGSTPTIAQLVTLGYLSAVPKCPSNGTYAVSASGVCTCTATGHTR